MIQATKNLFVETGLTACNLGCLVTGAGVVMIDTPMKPSDALRWRATVESKGTIRYVINTEEHPDHWLGSFFFPGTLITSACTRTRLAKFPVKVALDEAAKLDPQACELMKDYRVRMADITFNDSLTIHLGDQRVELFSLPGHSAGGIAVYLPEERAVFTTDIVFHQKKSWLPEADPFAWLRSLDRLRALDVEVIVPGHGEPCPRQYLDEQSGIIQSWIDVVKDAMKKGLTVDEAATTIVCPDPYPKQEKTPMTEAQLNQAIVRRLYQVCS